jgi:hypothetical protein
VPYCLSAEILSVPAEYLNLIPHQTHVGNLAIKLDHQFSSQVMSAAPTSYASNYLTCTVNIEVTCTKTQQLEMDPSTINLSQPWKVWYQANPACNPLASAISLARDSQGALPQKARHVDLSKPKGQQVSQAKHQSA